MSKLIKQLEMESLRKTFQDVRDLVVLSITGLNSQTDHGLRAALRAKNIRLKVVKNSLTRRVFGELGLKVGDDSPYWLGPTALAWGGPGSIAELSRELDGELRQPKNAPLYKDKVTIKGAIADGVPIPFERARLMPTRPEAIARVVTLALSPAARLVGQIRGPASRVAGQIKSKGEGKEEGSASPATASA
jgi:large subunit ribosomal protein L10